MISRRPLGEMFAGFNSMASDVWDYREDLQNVAAVSMGEGRAADEGPTALFAALGKLHIPRGETSVRNWLHIVVTNVSMALAGGPLLRDVDVYLDETAVGKNPVELDAPPGVEEELVLRTRILDVFAALPDRYQAVLLLKTGHGLTMSQTASLLDMSTAATRSVLYRARRRLRSVLAG